MTDKPDSKSGVKDWVKNLVAFILGAIALFKGITEFIKLFQGNDAELITWIILIVCITLLCGICLYYARFWQPEKDDQGTAGFTPLTDERVKKQARKEKQRKLIRRAAIAGLILIPLISLTSFGYWQHLQNQPSKDILILVADFEGPDAQNYFVTKTIYENLEIATEPYRDVKVKRLNKVIQERKEARENGASQKASIVIWGSYGKTKDKVPISANFELLNPPQYLPELGAEAKGKVRTAAVAELENLTLQTRLSQEMNYLTLVTLGISRYAADDWDGAILLLTNALEQTKEPIRILDQSKIFFARGFSYREKKRYDLAIADYNKIITLKPNDSLVYYNRGVAYQDKKAHKQALIDYTKAIEINRGWGDRRLNDAYYNRGNAYRKLKQFDRAIADFAQAIKLKPDDAAAYINRGVTYGDLKQFDREIADYTQAIKLKPDYALAYNNRGYAYSDLKQFDRAIADYTQAIELKPDYADAYINRGYAYSKLKQFDQVISDFTQVIKLKPDDAAAYNSRGIIYGEKKDYAKALADLNKGLELQPHSADIYDSRGTVYRYMGNFEQALKDYNQAIKLDPTIDESHLWRAVIYLKQGNQQSAIKDFQKVLELTNNLEFKQRAEQELKKLGVK